MNKRIRWTGTFWGNCPYLWYYETPRQILVCISPVDCAPKHPHSRSYTRGASVPEPTSKYARKKVDMGRVILDMTTCPYAMSEEGWVSLQSWANEVCQRLDRTKAAWRNAGGGAQ